MAGQIDDTAHGMMNGIYESSQHLLNLINNVLDISKIEAGRLDVVYAQESLPELVESWRRQTEVLAKKKGLSFNIDIAPDVPETLSTDAERLSQIVINLLGNAFKFTEEGGVNFRIFREDGSLLLSVTDTGIGIAPHALHYIFDEFRQVDSSAQRVYGGTGLGLAIARKLCLALGGNIHVTSKMGEGSTFTVTLPMQQPVAV
jgi:signal transduction histidine kinase